MKRTDTLTNDTILYPDLDIIIRDDGTTLRDLLNRKKIKQNARGRCPKDSYEPGTFKCDPSLSDAKEDNLSKLVEKVKAGKAEGTLSKETVSQLKSAISESKHGDVIKIPETIDPNIRSEIEFGYDSIVNDIPKASEAIKGIEAVDTNFTVNGKKIFTSESAIASSYNGKIYLNKAKLEMGADKVREDLSSDVRIGHHPPGCDTIKSAIDHEVGHIIYDYLKDIQQYSLTDDVVFDNKKGWGLGTIGGTIKEWEKANIKMAPPSDYAKRSRDANKETNEMWAEGFASLRNTPPEKQSEYVKKMGMLFEFLKNTEWKELNTKTRTTTPRDPKMKAFKAKIGIGK